MHTGALEYAMGLIATIVQFLFISSILLPILQISHLKTFSVFLLDKISQLLGLLIVGITIVGIALINLYLWNDDISDVLTRITVFGGCFFILPRSF